MASSRINENYSTTAIVSVNPDLPPVYFKVRKESNSQYDFAKFLYTAILDEYLLPGDILIMDNATVHHGDDTFLEIMEVLKFKNISLYLLPTYSPELSPIELIFNVVKHHIRHRRIKPSLKDAITDAISTITTQNVVGAFANVIINYINNPLNVPNNLLNK